SRRSTLPETHRSSSAPAHAPHRVLPRAPPALHSKPARSAQPLRSRLPAIHELSRDSAPQRSPAPRIRRKTQRAPTASPVREMSFPTRRRKIASRSVAAVPRAVPCPAVAEFPCLARASPDPIAGKRAAGVPQTRFAPDRAITAGKQNRAPFARRAASYNFVRFARAPTRPIFRTRRPKGTLFRTRGNPGTGRYASQNLRPARVRLDRRAPSDAIARAANRLRGPKADK